MNARHGPDEHEVARGIRAGFIAYAIWGLLTIYWKQLHDFEPFELIGWRIATSGVIMIGVLTVRGRWPAMRTAFGDRRLMGRITVAALLLTTNWTAYVYAVVNDRVIETALGYFMAPLGTMALGIVVLKERPTQAQKIAMGLAAVAVVILTISYGRPPYAELTLVSLAGVATVVPLVMFAFAATRVPFTILGPLNYLVPTINFLLGWILYDEELPVSRFVGFAFVWVALAVLTADRLRTTVVDRRDLARLRAA